MSARQLRRLQNLVKVSTGADADDDNGNGAEEYPSTMKMPKSGTKKAKGQRGTSDQQAQRRDHVHQKPEKPQPQGEEKEQQQKQQQQQVVTTSTAKNEPRKMKSGGRDDNGPAAQSRAMKNAPAEEKPVIEAEDATVNSSQQEVMKRPHRKKQRGKNNKARRREEELEEELLLEAVLRQREGDAIGNSRQRDAGCSAEEETDLLELLSICDPKMLDTRLERIWRFGVGAVEDVGDGRVPQRRADSRPSSLLFAQHLHTLPRFRHSVLATPNRYCWPPYYSLGEFIAAKDVNNNNNGEESSSNSSNSDGCGCGCCGGGGGGGSGGCSPVHYLYNATPEARRADAALAFCESHHGGLAGIMECISSAPYHIPTLMVASSAFETMGDVPRTQEVIDLALYHVGVLLSRFPLRQTVRHRCVPFCIPANRQVFQILRCGVHQALRKAATRAAWEIAKLIYSLDSTDPLGMLLQLDYLALRTKGWGWLLEVYFIVTRELARDTNGAEGDTVSHMWSNRTLALALSALPGFFFSAALVKHFLEREELARACGSGPGENKPSKVIRDMTAAQLRAFHNTPSASVMLADAIGRFPSAAVLLVEKVGEQTLLPSAPPPWRDVVKAHETSTEESLHVAALWVARNTEMWKAAEPTAFLRRVLTEDNGLWLSSYSPAAAGAGAAAALRRTALPTSWSHASLREEDLMKQTMMTIPAHLLDADEITEEDMRDATRRATLRELTPLEQDALLRFRALYGPLSPATLTPAQQLMQYTLMFDEEGRERRIGEEQNPFMLFLRTFLPWNSTRDMALLAALEAAGIPDPVVENNRQRRLEDEAFWQHEEEADEAEWETESSWESDEYVGNDNDTEESGAA
ncbi:putative transcription factor 25-like [Trypanosoma grayi]|uniref:putative transcription factor 25-like n=1 Tax=Trypanosoma grayi TaxID=71804 RepID=UPI0004F4279D|nr:putative transcription factor 25-like [Trypanosoma grayi]KEG14298.1 putative transcription factor 25-like [Trypanosoma grayi]